MFVGMEIRRMDEFLAATLPDPSRAVRVDIGTHNELVEIEKKIQEATAKHNAFLTELVLSPLP
jgi:hypothetical protein